MNQTQMTDIKIPYNPFSTGNSILKGISVPKWLPRVDGFSERTFFCDTNYIPRSASIPFVVSVYGNRKQPDQSFAMAWIVDEFMNPFDGMSHIWRFLSLLSSTLPPRYNICGDGTIRHPQAHLGGSWWKTPASDALFYSMQDMAKVYHNWQRVFKNETSLTDYGHLIEACGSIFRMEFETRSNSVGNEIEKERQVIQKARERINELEEYQNLVYERAADGLNILEKHGYSKEDISYVLLENGEW